MEQVIFEAQSRTPDGKGGARKTRGAGMVPGVAYGHGLDPAPLSVDERALSTLLRRQHGSNVLLDLKVDGEAPEGLAAIIKTMQTDPMTDDILSVDFQWVSLSEKVTVAVSVRLQGLAEGVAEGGVLDQMLYEASISCLPLEIPDELTLDVTALTIGDTLHVSALTAPEGVEILGNPEDPVVTVRAPVVIVEPEPEVEEGEEVEGEEVEGEEAADEAAEEEGKAEAEVGDKE